MVKTFQPYLARVDIRKDSFLLKPCLYEFVDSSIFRHQIQYYIIVQVEAMGISVESSNFNSIQVRLCVGVGEDGDCTH
jgi:hypothetical protein